jgi:hypothetical protein
MNIILSKLIPAIVSFIKERDSYASKTKLLKILYLFDVEYYRVHRNVFTGFDWIYYHLGPWTSEYDEVLEGLLAHNLLIMSKSSNPSYDTEFYRTPTFVDLNGIFESYKDESILKNVLYTWGEKSTPEILDHVYFQTEPMLHGKRLEKLDFSTIPEQAPIQYKRTKSGKTKDEIEAFRKKVRDKIQASNPHNERTSAFTPPNYDEEFFEAMERLEEISS